MLLYTSIPPYFTCKYCVFDSTTLTESCYLAELLFRVIYYTETEYNTLNINNIITHCSTIHLQNEFEYFKYIKPQNTLQYFHLCRI